MSYDLDFSSYEVTELPVKGPDGKEYLLREASGDAAVKFKNAQAACITLTGGKVSTVRGQDNTIPLLVSMCLFPVIGLQGGGTGPAKQHVSETLIRGWPNKIQAELFKVAKEISEIGTDDDLTSLKKQRDELNKAIAEIEEDQVKNEQDGTTDGSD